MRAMVLPDYVKMNNLMNSEFSHIYHAYEISYDRNVVQKSK